MRKAANMTGTKVVRSIWLLACILLLFPSASAAHYVVGEVADALDSTSANGKMIVLWDPSIGIADNITDIVGTSGNSGVDNTYFLDCEMLSSPCGIGSVINAKVFDDGDHHFTTIVNVTITGAGYDLMPSLALNTPPTIALISPVPAANFTSSTVSLFCNATDLDGNLANVTLYGNWSNGWHANETLSNIAYTYNASFTKSLPDGRYSWSCLVRDSLNTFSFASQNRTFTVDATPPNITSLKTNLSDNFFGYQFQARVYCNVTDALTGLRNISFKLTSPSGINTTTIGQLFMASSYYTDVNVDAVGRWNLTCTAQDNVGNNNTRNLTINAVDSIADLELFPENITFSGSFIESEPIDIRVQISNIGGLDASGFQVAFFLGPKENGIQIGDNITASIPTLSNATYNMTFYPAIGDNTIYVYADIADTVSEINEANNYASKTSSIVSWQNFYGKLSVEKVLGSAASTNLSAWNQSQNTSGNIFVVDRDSSINWFSLEPVGKDTLGDNTTNDFLEIDSLLNMTGLSDSISKVYTNNTNTTFMTDSFQIFKRTVNNVPIARSTNNTNFMTGILWDTTKNTNTEFDTANKEDIVFVTKVNQNAVGAYGTYDYEIRVPATLRNYNTGETSRVDFYYDLV